MSSKTALITGCSSGIGYALAVEFARRGIQVIATARNVESLKDLEAESANIIALPLDVCDSANIQQLHEKVDKITGGKLSYLVNNAGSHYAAPAIELDIERVRQVFETNVFGVIQMCSTFSKMLIADHGTIVQIGSVTRDVPVVWQSAYNATKAALSQYSKTLRLELEPFGVKVSEIVTGYVQSNILRDGLHCEPGSLYIPLKSHISKLKNDGNRSGTTAASYAFIVVDLMLSTNPPSETWQGVQSWQLWFIVTWLPTWLRHRIFYSVFRLATLRRR